jgi:2,3-bisphosphoglycerate-independent phosphoglycerate mutase
MSARGITAKVLEIIDSKKSDLIIVNFANGDMVGHTGNLKKTIEALEVVDGCIGEIYTKLQEVKGSALITADHGNSEQMINLQTGEAITAHTLFDVPLIVIDKKVKKLNPGALSDIAPTILDLMGMNNPGDMTGHSLVQKK